ncbi:hypothetical protein FS842_005204, partial [Serendipita sp. 407]
MIKVHLQMPGEHLPEITLLVRSTTYFTSDCDINLQTLHVMSDPRQLIKQIKDRLQTEGRHEQITFAYQQVGTAAVAQWTCTYS